MLTRRVLLRGSAVAIAGAGAMPGWLARAAQSADLPGARKKILIAIFQRGAADGLNIIIPFAEKRYYEMRPSICDRGAGKYERPESGTFWRICHRPRRALRAESRARIAENIVEPEATRDCGSDRFARPIPFAFRRPGLHGIRHARQSDRRRMAESRPARAHLGNLTAARHCHGRSVAAHPPRRSGGHCGQQRPDVPVGEPGYRRHSRKHVFRNARPASRRIRAKTRSRQ